HLPDKWSSPVWASGAWTGAYFNVPGFLIVFILTLLLVRGVRESAEANNVMVLIKIGAILTFLVVGGMLVHKSNWVPFAPSGFGGVLTGDRKSTRLNSSHLVISYAVFCLKKKKKKKNTTQLI